MTITLALTTLTVVFAAAMHRVSGMGFALVAMPVLVLVHGSADGLRLGLVLGLFVSVIALASCWRDLQATSAALLAAPAVVTIPLGAWLVGLIDPDVTLIVLGAMLAVLLGLTMVIRTLHAGRFSVGTALAAGSVAGLVHVMSGLSAPVLTAYAIRTAWSQRAFIATAQVVFIVLNIGSLAARRVTWPELGAGGLLVPALVVGVVGGAKLSRMLSPASARRISLSVAVVAAVTTAVKGMIGVLS